MCDLDFTSNQDHEYKQLNMSMIVCMGAKLMLVTTLVTSDAVDVGDHVGDQLDKLGQYVPPTPSAFNAKSMIICDTRYKEYAILRSDHLNTTSGPFHIKVCWIVGKKAALRRGIRLEFLWWWLVVGPMVGPAISCHRLRFIFV